MIQPPELHFNQVSPYGSTTSKSESKKKKNIDAKKFYTPFPWKVVLLYALELILDWSLNLKCLIHLL